MLEFVMNSNFCVSIFWFLNQWSTKLLLIILKSPKQNPNPNGWGDPQRLKTMFKLLNSSQLWLWCCFHRSRCCHNCYSLSLAPPECRWVALVSWQLGEILMAGWVDRGMDWGRWFRKGMFRSVFSSCVLIFNLNIVEWPSSLLDSRRHTVWCLFWRWIPCLEGQWCESDV